MTENVAKSRSARITGRIFFYIVVVIRLFFVLFPMFWMFLASFKTNADILNMSKLFNYDFAKPIINSLIVSLVSTVLSLILGLPAAYSIAREKQHLFSGIILMIRIVPAVSFLVPWYILFTNLHLSGTYLSLIICHLIVSLPLIVWIMIPYYETLPQELEQSAYIDGASRFGTFIRIMLPLSTPGILTSGILAFIFSWNNFMFALVLCSNDTTTLPIAIYQFISYSNVDWGGIMCASVVITLPIIIISFFLQRYIITGLTAGAVKG